MVFFGEGAVIQVIHDSLIKISIEKRHKIFKI